MLYVVVHENDCISTSYETLADSAQQAGQIDRSRLSAHSTKLYSRYVTAQ